LIGILDAPQVDDYPASIDVSKLHLKEPTPGSVTFEKGKLNDTVEYSVTYGAVPVGAIPRPQFEGGDKKGKHVLYYSACRTANVRFTAEARQYSSTVLVADPHYLQAIAFPQKGKI